MKYALTITLALFLIVAAGMAAAVDGSWRIAFDTEVGDRIAVADLTQNGATVKGKFRGEGSSEGIDIEGSYTNGELSISFPFHSPDAGYKADLKLKAKVDGGKMTGQWEFDGYTGAFTGTKQ